MLQNWNSTTGQNSGFPQLFLFDCCGKGQGTAELTQRNFFLGKEQFSRLVATQEVSTICHVQSQHQKREYTGDTWESAECGVQTPLGDMF